MIILRSTGPVISTRRSCRSAGIAPTFQSPLRTAAVSARKSGRAPALKRACVARRRSSSSSMRGRKRRVRSSTKAMAGGVRMRSAPSTIGAVGTGHKGTGFCVLMILWRRFVLTCAAVDVWRSCPDRDWRCGLPPHPFRTANPSADRGAARLRPARARRQRRTGRRARRPAGLRRRRPGRGVLVRQDGGLAADGDGRADRLCARRPAPGARTAIEQAAATVTEFSAIDKRARDYLKSGQQLMAGDVIFTEGSDAAATAAAPDRDRAAG